MISHKKYAKCQILRLFTIKESIICSQPIKLQHSWNAKKRYIESLHNVIGKYKNISLLFDFAPIQLDRHQNFAFAASPVIP
jgi:hypothetical protein